MPVHPERRGGADDRDAKWQEFVGKLALLLARRPAGAAVMTITVTHDAAECALTTELIGFEMTNLAKLAAIGYLLSSLEQSADGDVCAAVRRVHKLYSKLFLAGGAFDVGRRQ